MSSEIALIVSFEAAWGRDALVDALGRAVEFRRFKAADVRSILEAGNGVATIMSEGQNLGLGLPEVPVRDLAAYSLEALG